MEHLNPQALIFVQDYMERHSDDLKELQTWGKPYFDMMDDVLAKNNIPKQLKYLAVIESNLKASATSWVGAVGPWQFMPATARTMGLHVSRGQDERRDYLKSTKAASKYLNYLFDIYEDWLLVVAAYNCGPGRVNSAIAKAGSSDFWKLQYYLPTESRNHVKKFIATHYIMEGEGGITTVTKEKALAMMATVKDEVTSKDVKVQTISGRYNSKAIIKHLGMNIDEFSQMNPSMDKVLASNNTYQLKLPIEKMEIFLSKKNEMLNESIQMLINPEYRN
ncbi:lytic transglycosylase domain-containing protein [Niabella ginsengisoli]|uniref:Lytic transglycosylase domain-containing protein n=1 Tax=Niabella ginsengisoli TaxID=522298 RepID=A0ABS9SE70_9BACT|nr:lytic transglycosylase domain-containing protein [Niabella ginsengisoli]MCH5596651.1 lytic transglycosylase domain-containing protein [Niabella ginsengisoli]